MISNRARVADVAVAVLAVAIFVAQIWRLPEAVQPASDEGVFALAGSLLVAGYVPHRDFPLWHMPTLPLAIAGGRALLGGMTALRLVYVAMNCAGAVLLYLVLKRLTPIVAAAVAGAVFYLSCYEMVHQDFRFIAVRQPINLLLIAYAWCALAHPREGWSWFCRGVACVVATLLFLPAWLVFAPAALALVTLDATAERRRTLRRTVVVLLAAALAASLYLLLADGAFRQIVVDQYRRPATGRLHRLAIIWDRPDWFFAACGGTGLLLGVAAMPRLRALGAALLAGALLTVFAPTTYLFQYLTPAAPALAIGVCLGCAVLVRASRRAFGSPRPAYALCAALMSCQLALTTPALLRAWLGNRAPGYGEAIATIARTPEPLLTVAAIVAVDADRQPVIFDALFRPPGASRESVDELVALERRACTILIDDRMRAVLPFPVIAEWERRFPTRVSTALGTVLLTRHTGCGEWRS